MSTTLAGDELDSQRLIFIASSKKPAPGTKFGLPIMLVGEIREGKILKMRGYFDLLTLTEAGTPHHLYS